MGGDIRLSDQRSLFERGPIVVFTWRNEAGWPVEFVSPNVVEVFGYEGQDFLDGRVAYGSLVHPDDLERSIDMVATSIDQVGHPRDFSPPVLSRARHRDGSYKFVSVTGSVVAQRHGHAGDVLLAISNDLRTPILSIQGMVELFRAKYAEAVPDVTALHYLELTQRNADQIATLIEEMAKRNMRVELADKVVREAHPFVNQILSVPVRVTTG